MECGQIDDIEIVAGDPHGLDERLRAANALSKIPTLVTEEGVALPESDLICLYLDARSGGLLAPAGGVGRWRTLRLHALADGFMEAAVDRRSEALRPEDERSRAELDKLFARMERSLDALDAETDAAPGARPDIGAIASAVACSYADFRYSDWNWRSGRSKLAAFYAEFAARPSMQATELYE